LSEIGHKIRVWDAPTRLFHWLTAALVVVAYVTWRLNWMDWHAKAGDAVLTLVLFRLLWGFFGSDTARFSSFLAPPRAAVRYLTHALHREPDRAVGHNPAGGWMVLVLLALLFGETLTGLYVDNDVANDGPFTALTPAPVANAIATLHVLFWDLLLAAIALHILAILLYAAAKGQNLVSPMIRGWKTLPAGVPQPRQAGPLRASLLLGCSAIAIAVLVNVV
jgi:cytochrome b